MTEMVEFAATSTIPPQRRGAWIEIGWRLLRAAVVVVVDLVVLAVVSVVPVHDLASWLAGVAALHALAAIIVGFDAKQQGESVAEGVIWAFAVLTLPAFGLAGYVFQRDADRGNAVVAHGRDDLLTRVSVSRDGLAFRWCCPQCDCWNPNRRTDCVDCGHWLVDEELASYAEASALALRPAGVAVTWDDMRRACKYGIALLILVGLGYFIVIPLVFISELRQMMRSAIW